MNAIWAEQSECRGLLVDDLIVRDGSLVLTTSEPVAFQIASGAQGQSICSAQGWNVASFGGTDRSPRCAEVICRMLNGAPQLATRMSDALSLAVARSLEAPPPIAWQPAVVSAAEVVWCACCLATLALFACLAGARLARTRTASRGGLENGGLAFLASIVAIGLLLRFWIATQAPVELDETGFAGFDSLWREFDARETMMNPPLYRALSAPWMWATGGSPTLGRAVPVLLGGALVALMGRLGFLLAGRAAGFASALLTAFHPGLVVATVFHRSYALLVVATASTVIFTELASRLGRRIDRYLVAVCLAASSMTHYFGLAVVLGTAVWIAVADRERRREWIGPAALVVLLCAPFMPAVLAGLDFKADQVSVDHSAGGVAHALGIALALPSVVSGLIRPPLQGLVYVDHHAGRLLLNGCLLAAALFCGARRLPRATRTGLLALVVAAILLPIAAATRLATVREIHGIAAAIPAIAIFSTVAAARSGALAVSAGVVLLLASLFIGPHLLLPRTAAPFDAAAAAVREDASHWPIFVWPAGDDAFKPVALRVGVSRQVADASTDGRDARIRPLRSCSTAAVREAGASAARTSVTIFIVDDTCGPRSLSGRGVRCGESRELSPGVVAATCAVDPQTPTPPASLAARLVKPERAIPIGEEQRFLDVVAPFQLGEKDERGVILANVGIEWNAVVYELRSPAEQNAAARIRVSPGFVDEEVVGSRTTLEPTEPELPPKLAESARALSDALVAHLTAAAWNEIYRPLTVGAVGADVRPRGWLAVSAIAGLVLAGALVRDRRRSLRAAVDP